METNEAIGILEAMREEYLDSACISGIGHGTMVKLAETSHACDLGVQALRRQGTGRPPVCRGCGYLHHYDTCIYHDITKTESSKSCPDYKS